MLADESDNQRWEIQNHLQSHSSLFTSFLSSANKNNTQEALKEEGAVFLTSENPAFLEQANPELMKKTTWFIPSGTDLRRLKLRLDSNVFLYSSNDNHSLKIHEIYSIKNGPQIQHFLGSWTPEQGLTMTPLSKWERRNNLNNVKLISTVLAQSLYPTFTYTQTETGIEASGFLPDIVQELSSVLNFSYTYVAAQDGLFGALFPNGSWNGMVGILQRQEADISTSTMFFSPERIRFIDFSTPLIDNQMTAIIRKTAGYNSVNVWAYTKIFSTITWIVILLTLASLVIVLTLVGNCRIEGSHSYGFNVAFGFVFQSLLQRDFHLDRQSHSTHLMTVIICMYCFMIFTYFSATLTSFMTVLEPSMQINSFEDILKQDYHMLTIKDTTMEAFLKAAKPPSVFYEIYNKDMRNNPGASLASLDEAQKALLDNPRNVLFGPGLLSYTSPELVSLDLPESVSSYVGFAYQKNSEFTQIFDYHMLKMKQSGVWSTIESKWFNMKRADSFDGQMIGDAAVTLDFDNLIFPYLVLCIGIGAASLCVMCEVIIRKVSKIFEVLMYMVSW